MSTTNELRQLSPEELEARAAEIRQQVFEMKGKLNTGVLDSTADLKKSRRLAARCKTIAREKQLGIVRTAKTETRKGKKE
jgi:large subunit ribosomal protein L29